MSEQDKADDLSPGALYQNNREFLECLGFVGESEEI